MCVNKVEHEGIIDSHRSDVIERRMGPTDVSELAKDERRVGLVLVNCSPVDNKHELEWAEARVYNMYLISVQKKLSAIEKRRCQNQQKKEGNQLLKNVVIIFAVLLTLNT